MRKYTRKDTDNSDWKLKFLMPVMAQSFTFNLHNAARRHWKPSPKYPSNYKPIEQHACLKRKDQEVTSLNLNLHLFNGITFTQPDRHHQTQDVVKNSATNWKGSSGYTGDLFPFFAYRNHNYYKPTDNMKLILTDPIIIAVKMIHFNGIGLVWDVMWGGS